MRKIVFALVTLFAGAVFPLSAQAPQYEISVTPVNMMQSWYDFMIGGYMDTPVVVQSPEQGGDIFMMYQAMASSAAPRRIHLARIDQSGVVESDNEYSYFNNVQGYGSVACDPVSGKPLFTWHENYSDPANSNDVAFSYGYDGEELPPPDWRPDIAISNPFTVGTFTQNEFIWPTLTIGPSPIADKQRVYIVGRNSKHNVTSNMSQNVLLAYADFSSNDLSLFDRLNWKYVTIPEMNDWWSDTSSQERRFNGTLVCGDNGKIYLIGSHAEYLNEETDYSQYLTVFINDNYGIGIWRRISQPAEQLQSQVNDVIPDWDLNAIDAAPWYSSHFNAVKDTQGRIHYPQLYSGTEGSGSFYPSMFAIRDVWFDTATETFSINDLFPQGATPHSDPCYTPWDIDENHWVDEFMDGYVYFPTIFPFPYWDQTAHGDAMMFYYNHIRMTAANASGAMACIWSDSSAGEYDHSFPGPETYISVSPDNGFTWLPPIVLNPVDNPNLSQTMTFVNPANKMIEMGLDNQGKRIYRLFLLYFDDNTWGAGSLSPAELPADGGTVSYMALDIHLPVVSAADEVTPVTQIELSAFPNPFNPSCTLQFSLPKSGKADLCIYNLKGQKVRTLLSGTTTSGESSVIWNGKDDAGRTVSSGLYFARLITGQGTAVKKLILLK